MLENRKSLNDTTKPLEDDVPVILNTAAFMPFSIAPRSCPGKNLALMELRVTAASVMQRFDMKVAEGFDLAGWENSLQDCFVVKKGALPVNLTARA